MTTPTREELEQENANLRAAAELALRYFEGQAVGAGRETFSYVPVVRAIRAALEKKHGVRP